MTRPCVPSEAELPTIDSPADDRGVAMMRGMDVDLGELYHENSKLHRGDRAFGGWVQLINQTSELQTTLVRSWRSHRGTDVVALGRGAGSESPPPETTVPSAAEALDAILSDRRSVRRFSGPITLSQLGDLLRMTYGHIRPARHDGHLESRRSCPSAGALYTLELYVQVRQVDGLVPGIYHYQVRENALARIKVTDSEDDLRLGEAIFNPEMQEGAAAVVWFVGVMGRCRYKYRHRAYRFVLLEAGHAAQTLLLRTTALGLGACALGGFFDDEVADVLGVDSVDEPPVYGVILGNPKKA